MPDLPTGTVTFLFTDIEGSTRLWEQHPEAMEAALARHDALALEIVQQHAGRVVKHRGEGDSLFAVFARAADAVSAALSLQQSLCQGPWPAETALRVRMALHTGEATVREGDYLGPAVNRCARLRAAAHGGQVLLSQATCDQVRDTLPAGAGLRDLGARRLKDLQQPEHIFQLLHPALPGEFPPLRSLETYAHNLPAPLTRFIGREREIAETKRLLATTRLLTLTGSGGCGKTRLALQVAADLLEEYADGVWLAELAALADPALVPQAVASALGVREEPGRPLSQTLGEYLRSRHLLLVLDNCEHLLLVCAQLTDTLLRACPKLRILATSREGLGIGGEQTYRVPSLSLPDLKQLPPLDRLLEYEAVQLFADRAGLAQSNFAVTQTNAPAVVQVCQRLEGIPLALELAAARVKLLSVEQIAARLDDAFRLLTGGSRTALPRQQTLRALIDWSYDLLSEAERTLLRRLSVFAGGWTLEAAEAVCAGEEIEEREVLDLLGHLVDKSLIDKSLLRQVEEEERPAPEGSQQSGRHGREAVVVPAVEGEARFSMLETIREFGRERLVDSGEEGSLRRQHAEFFLALAERADLELVGPNQAAWLARLKAEHYNLRAVLEWCVLHPEHTDIGLRSAAGLVLYWDVHGHYTEGSGWLERLLGNSDHASREEHAKGLQAAGDFARLQGENSRAVELASQSLALAREIGDNQVVARSLQILSSVTYIRGDVASARVLAAESLSIFRELGDKPGVARSVHQLGVLSLREGDYAEAGARFEESLAMNREQGNGQRIALSIYCLALVAQGRGDYRAADACLRESVAIAQGLGYQRILVMCVEGFAAGAAAEGRNEQAARLLGAADRVREVMHLPPQPNEGASVAHSRAVLRAAMGDTAFHIARAEGQEMSLEEAISRAIGSGQ
jgi:predicted ATPase/class 3 adenylate cyclase